MPPSCLGDQGHSLGSKLQRKTSTLLSHFVSVSQENHGGSWEMLQEMNVLTQSSQRQGWDYRSEVVLARDVLLGSHMFSLSRGH